MLIYTFIKLSQLDSEPHQLCNINTLLQWKRNFTGDDNTWILCGIPCYNGLHASCHVTSLISTEQSLLPSVTERHQAVLFSLPTNSLLAVDSFRYDAVQWQMLVAHVIYTFTHTMCYSDSVRGEVLENQLESRHLKLDLSFLCVSLYRTGEVKDWDQACSLILLS